MNENFERIGQYLKEFKEQSKNKQRLYILAFCFVFLAVCFALGCVSGLMIQSILSLKGGTTESVIYYGFVYPSGRTFTIVFCVGLILLIIYVLTRINRQNRVSMVDERGVRIQKDGTYGTSRWMEKREAKDVYEVANIKDTTTTIYGQFSEKGEQVCGYALAKSGASGNRNTIIIGPPGTGKSFVYVRTELLQSVLRGQSFVVTDPSGELYGSNSQYARDHGYDVKVLNLADPEHSDCWDCLEETINPETKRVDSTRLNEFVSIYMKNSSDNEGKSEEKFWFDCATNLLTAVIGYAAYRRENYIADEFKELYQKVTSINRPENSQIFIAKLNKMSFTKAEQEIRAQAKANGFDKKEVNEIIKRIYETAPAYNIGLVYDFLTDFNKVESQIQLVPSWHPAAIAYKIFQTNSTSDTVRGSALQGAQMRMQMFQDEKIRVITSNKGIHLSEVNGKPSAYFVIMSDKTTNTKAIASLFFSFLFKDTQNEWDKADMIAREMEIPNKKLPVNIILDEFFSIGVIGGSPKAFTTTMANARKRQLYISIIVQAFPSQVEELYGQDNTTTILGCCGMLLMLGCNDKKTAEFISTYIGESATIQSESHDESGGLVNTTGTNIKASASSRHLLTVDEVRRWKDKVLCAKQGQHPLVLKPFPWIEHPAYVNGEIKQVSLYSTIKNIGEFIEETTDYSNTEEPDYPTEIHTKIEKLTSNIWIDEETGEVKKDKSSKNKQTKSKKVKVEQMTLNVDEDLDNEVQNTQVVQESQKAKEVQEETSINEDDTSITF